MKLSGILEQKASLQILLAIKQSRWHPEHTLLVIYDKDPLWSCLYHLLKINGMQPKVLFIHENSYEKILKSIGSGSYNNDLILIQNKIWSSFKNVSNSTRDLCNLFKYIMFLEYPTQEMTLYKKLQPLYLRALSYPVTELVTKMATMRESVHCGCASIHSDGSVVKCNVKKIFDDFTVLNYSKQILQLPLGEVWMLVDQVNGTVNIENRPNKIIKMQITNGSLSYKNFSLSTLVEVGFGMNPFSFPLPTSLCEKVSGRIHLGFGDDELMGGFFRESWHADILTEKGTFFTNDSDTR